MMLLNICVRVYCVHTFAVDVEVSPGQQWRLVLEAPFRSPSDSSGRTASSGVLKGTTSLHTVLKGCYMSQTNSTSRPMMKTTRSKRAAPSSSQRVLGNASWIQCCRMQHELQGEMQFFARSTRIRMQFLFKKKHAVGFTTHGHKAGRARF